MTDVPPISKKCGNCPFWLDLLSHLWQFRVEIEGYSVAYFDRIAVFEVLYR